MYNPNYKNYCPYLRDLCRHDCIYFTESDDLFCEKYIRLFEIKHSLEKILDILEEMKEKEEWLPNK